MREYLERMIGEKNQNICSQNVLWNCGVEDELLKAKEILNE